MRILIQRVQEAKVEVEKEIVGAIGKGLLVFLGIHKDDTSENIQWLINKLVNLRIFEDENGKMNRSIKEVEGDFLVVSQFTLYGNCTNGRRPDFIDSAPGPIAMTLYEQFIAELQKEMGKEIQTGKFGAYMQVYLLNDGPVTFMIEK